MLLIPPSPFVSRRQVHQRGALLTALLLPLIALLLGTPTHLLLASAQGLYPGAPGYGLNSGSLDPPVISYIYPPKGHTGGGTTLNVYGRGFVRTPAITIRFASESEFEDVLATFVSNTHVQVITPQASNPE